MILTCACKHDQQDKIHGSQKRVMNPTTKKDGERIVYRCTVCKALKTK